MYILRNVLSLIFEPLIIVFVLSLTGFLIFWVKKNKSGIVLVAFSFLLLFLSSFRPVSHSLMYKFEHLYSPLKAGSVQTEYIAVLGGWAGYDTSIPVISRLSNHSLARLVEGVRHLEKNHGSLIVFSGSGFKQPVSMAEMNAAAAMEMGVSRDRMILFNKPESTQDEAVFLKKMIRDKPFILVTSALHMKRAMLIFESYGMHPIPAPADYMVKKVKEKSFFYYLPSIHSIQIIEDYLHELVGILWFKLQMLKG